MTNNQQAFLELVRAGLWEKEAWLLPFGKVDYNEVMRLAEMQSVDGLITAGLEHIKDKKPPQEVVLQFIGQSLQLEQRNRAMNQFIGEIVEDMRNKGIYTILVKGQGLAQCYERPLWRPAGDIDFFFSKEEYPKAVEYFKQQNTEVVQDAQYTKSLGVVMDTMMVELHGTMRSGLSTRLDVEIDNVQKDVFYGGDVRSWVNGKTQVFLPGVNSDLFLLFTHFVRHFYQNEFVLRQVCDWCRFLWNFKGMIDVDLFEERLLRSGLMGEWKAFAAFVVEYLGMPMEATPLYDSSKRWNKKAEIILDFTMSGREKSKLKAMFTIGKIFPWNTMKFSPAIFFHLNWMKIKERLLP